MIRLTLILFLLGQNVFGQVPSYYADSRLNSINGGVNLEYFMTEQVVSNTTGLLTVDNVDALGGQYQSLIERYTNGVYTPSNGINQVGAAYAGESYITNLLATNIPNLMTDIAWTITNIVSGTAGYDNSTANSNGISSVIDLGNFGYSIPHTLDLRFVSQSAFFKSLASIIRNVILSCVYGFLWFLCYEDIVKETDRAMSQRQLEGPTQTLFGFNASLVLGCFLAGLISTALFVNVHAWFSSGFMVNAYAHFPAIYNYIAAAPTSVPAYDILTAFVPFTEIITAWVTYLMFYIFILQIAGFGVKFFVLLCVS